MSRPPDDSTEKTGSSDLPQGGCGPNKAGTELASNFATLEKRLDRLSAKVRALSKPFYKRTGFWGAFCAAGMSIAAYILAPLWMDNDPALPRFFHRQVLRTDQALASGLETDAGIPSDKQSTALFPALRSVVGALLTQDDGTREKLTEIVRSRQRDHFHGVAYFVPRVLPISSLCDSAADPNFSLVLTDRKRLDRLIAACREKPFVSPRRMIEDPSLLIPFSARASDRVTLKISLLESVQIIGGPVETVEMRALNPKNFVELSLGDAMPVEIPAPADIRHVEVDLPVNGPGEQHFVTLRLNEMGRGYAAGEEPPQETPRPITLSAVVTVDRM